MTNLNEELQVDVSQEEQEQSFQPETTEDTNLEETTEQTEEATQEEKMVTLSKSEYTKLKRRAIAYQSLKENQPAPLKEKTGSSDINKDELYLVAKGYDDEALNKLKVIARGEGISMREAVSHDLFKVYQEKQQAEARKAKANLRASNGSGYNSPEPIVKPDMSLDQHKSAWAKMMSGK